MTYRFINWALGCMLLLGACGKAPTSPLPTPAQLPTTRPSETPSTDTLILALTELAVTAQAGGFVQMTNTPSPLTSTENGTSNELLGGINADNELGFTLSSRVASNLTDPNCPVPQGWVAHEVKRGDTLMGIAQVYAIDPKVLADINCLISANRLVVGQRVAVPPFDIFTPNP
ncbi:MAG: LysM peptidoglycan-binding domain-containing protein [Phototrophicaceae bacterium]